MNAAEESVADDMNELMEGGRSSSKMPAKDSIWGLWAVLFTISFALYILHPLIQIYNGDHEPEWLFNPLPNGIITKTVFEYLGIEE